MGSIQNESFTTSEIWRKKFFLTKSHSCFTGQIFDENLFISSFYRSIFVLNEVFFTLARLSGLMTLHGWPAFHLKMVLFSI